MSSIVLIYFIFEIYSEFVSIPATNSGTYAHCTSRDQLKISLSKPQTYSVNGTA